MAAASLSPLRGLRPATTLALVLVLASWAGTAAGDVERDLVRARAELMLERERSAQLADDLVKTEARLRAVESDLLALRHECALAAAKEEAARASAPPTMRNVHNARLRDEVDRLFWVERERQRRIQLDQADAFENGPKEITIACPNSAQVQISDLSDEERDLNECMVLNLHAPDLHSRLVLFCDGSTSTFHESTDSSDSESSSSSSSSGRDGGSAREDL